MLRPIDRRSLDETLPLLQRGFPHAPAFWAAGLDRLKRFQSPDPDAPAAYLLDVAGRAVGVILSIASQRTNIDGSTRSVVNLSSWFVDDEHRWRAPRMLQQLTADDDTLYTDLTPTVPVQSLIERLGFSRWTEGTLLFPLPLFALGRSGDAHVVPFASLSADSLPAPVKGMMADHAALGCLAAALWDGARLHPLIFSRMSRKGVPIARLLYAEDRSVVKRHLAAIARFLLREKTVVLAMSADRSERTPGSFFTQRAPPTFYKGTMNTSAIDHAYSEFVFLQI
ncbi:MAG: hypothetical protein Q8M26_06240 [Pseudolabrys sp.]|nr:hypothetical protein [Pseudolabrys sp.]